MLEGRKNRKEGKIKGYRKGKNKKQQDKGRKTMKGRKKGKRKKEESMEGRKNNKASKK